MSEPAKKVKKLPKAWDLELKPPSDQQPIPEGFAASWVEDPEIGKKNLALFNDAQRELEAVRYAAALKIARNGTAEIPKLRDTFRQIIAMSTLVGEDIEQMLKGFKELAKLEGWYSATKVKVSPDHDDEQRFMAEVEEARKKLK